MNPGLDIRARLDELERERLHSYDARAVYLRAAKAFDRRVDDCPHCKRRRDNAIKRGDRRRADKGRA